MVCMNFPYTTFLELTRAQVSAAYDALPFTTMDIDQSPLSTIDPLLLGDFHMIMDTVERSFAEEPMQPPSSAYYRSNLPGALLSLAIHFWEVMQRPKEPVKIPSNADETFYSHCMHYKSEARRQLYHSRYGTFKVPDSWHPDREFANTSLRSDAITGVDDYSFLRTTNQMLLIRFLSRISMAFHRHDAYRKKFQVDPLALRLFALHFSYKSWEANVISNATLPAYAPLVAYYNHLERFLEIGGAMPRISPTQLNPCTPYPVPAAETSLKPAFAVMTSLEAYAHSAKLYNATTLNTHLEDFHTAHAIVCLDQTNLSDSPYAKNPSAELADHLKALEAVGATNPSALSWFDSLCEVAKSGKLVRKRHYYVSWEEQDHLFRVAWEWKTLPSPKSLQAKERPVLVIAAFLARWARYVKTDCRIKVAIKIMETMLSMCSVAEDPEAQRKLVASKCLPRLLWLVPVPVYSPQLLQPDPLSTFLLLIPEMAVCAPILRLWFMNAIFTAICPSSSDLPTKLESKRNDFEIEASLSDLRRGPALHPNNVAIGVNPSLLPKHEASYKEYLKVVPPSTMKVAGTSSEMLHWLNYRTSVSTSRKFLSFAQALSQQLGPFPGVVPAVIDAIIENCATSKVPVLALFLKVAMTHLRISQPSTEAEVAAEPSAPPAPNAFDSSLMVVD